MSLRRFALLVAALLAAAQSFAALDSVTVRAEGSGPNREGALNAALVEAVSQVNGAAVAANLRTSMKEQVKEGPEGSSYALEERTGKDISTATQGVVQSWSIVQVGEDGEFPGLWRATVDVVVAQYKASKQLDRLRMAVVDFRLGSQGSRDDLALFSRAFTRELEAFLTQTRRFAMLDRSFLAEQQQELAGIASGASPTQELARLGQRAGTDYLIVGEVTEAGTTSESRTLKTTGRTVTLNRAKGRLDYRIIDVSSSQVKFASAAEGEVESNSLNDAARAAARSAGSKILNAIFPTRVVALSPGQVTLSQGGDTLAVGDEFTLLLLGERLRDPYTKESLGRQESPVGTVRVSSVQAKMATAEILTLEDRISTDGPLPALIARPLSTGNSDAAEKRAQREAVKDSGKKKLETLMESSSDDW